MGDVKAMETVVAESVWRIRLMTLLASAFGAVGMALAGAAVYGVVESEARSRTREIGIRRALGAGADDVMGLVTRRAARMVAVGLLGGIPAYLLASGLLRRVLFGLGGGDLRAAAGALALVSGLTLLASLGPARRALRVEPTRAIRGE